jgi:peptidyl-prolyl cis-trans isomerase A (cyclophilin A)
MKPFVSQAVILVLALVAPNVVQAQGKFSRLAGDRVDLYAVLSTSLGDIELRLFSKDAPKTVANFVGLAEGEKEYVAASTGVKTRGRFYDGVIFHRVIPGFMIQGGDQTGTGRGTPGYDFEDELQSQRTFSKPGLLAMANRGANTNGSQFFITVGTPRHLDGRHTIFGEVISGYSVVEAIANAPRDRSDRPIKEIKILKVTISEKAPGVPPAAKSPPKGPAPAAAAGGKAP